MSLTYVFLDANILMQFQRIDQVPWSTIAGTDEVTLVIPPNTIQELDKHKVGTDPRKRSRAKQAFADFKKWLGEGVTTEPVEIRKGIQLMWSVTQATSDVYAKYSLDASHPDDRLVASCLAFKESNPGSETVLITYDNYPWALANNHGLTGLLMPDKYLLPPDPDPAELELKESRKKAADLQRQNEELRNRIPQLAVEFEDQMHELVFELDEPITDPESWIQAELDKIKRQFPPLEPPSNTNANSGNLADLLSAVANLAQQLDPYRMDESKRNARNASIEGYYQRYDRYLRDRVEYNEYANRILDIELLLHNTGTCPATNIEVNLHFPDGFQLLEQKDLRKEPAPPLTPDEEADRFRGLMSVPRINPAVFAPPGSPPNVSKPTIRKTNSYEVNIGVRRLKHHASTPLRRLFLVLDSLDVPQSYTVDYTVHADEMLHPQSGTLTIKVE